MIILIAPFLRHKGIALYPFVLLKSSALKKDPVLLNHERIHLRQQLELLILPFYLIYLLNYLYNLIRYRNHHRAYREIVFEREAYENEKNLYYLKNRPLWRFMYI